jgi:hypothetical protein
MIFLCQKVISFSVKWRLQKAKSAKTPKIDYWPFLAKSPVRMRLSAKS